MKHPVCQILVVLLWLVGDCSLIHAEITDVKAYQAPTDELAEQSIWSEYEFHKSQVGYLVYDPEGTEILVQNNANKTFIPASVSKILTTIAALKVLGPDYRFKTELRYTGHISGQTLMGDLYLKGSGDPFLTSSDLMQMVRALAARNIDRIRGNFFYDEHALFKTMQINRRFEQDGTWNTGISALSSEFNRQTIHWKPSPGRGNMEAFFTPSLPFVHLEISRRKPSGVALFVNRDKGKETIWQISPKVSATGSKKLPVRQGGRFTAELFSKFARMNGIEMPEPKPSKTPEEARQIRTHTSLPLVRLCKSLLEYSSNLMAELILLQTAKELAHEKLSLKESAQTVQNWLERNIPGLHASGFEYWNGSGLNSKSRVSPVHMVNALNYADAIWGHKLDYGSLLPISGWTGSLRRRMIEPDIALRVWAKTGTISYASGVAGYLYPHSGRRLLFSIFITDYRQRKQFESGRDSHSRQDIAAARRWTERARSLEEALLKRWVARL
jgi:D-alanyl-D-alanine carboxypeptidase/D-alanyl-D-alanine-endopeptidase (penicillin-binding protein 4)